MDTYLPKRTALTHPALNPVIEREIGVHALPPEFHASDLALLTVLELDDMRRRDPQLVQALLGHTCTAFCFYDFRQDCLRFVPFLAELTLAEAEDLYSLYVVDHNIEAYVVVREVQLRDLSGVAGAARRKLSLGVVWGAEKIQCEYHENQTSADAHQKRSYTVKSARNLPDWMLNFMYCADEVTRP